MNNNEFSHFKRYILSKFSHEFNTPLNIILNMVNFIEQKNKDNEISTYLKNIKDESLKIKELLNSLYYINNNLKTNINFEHFNLKDLVSSLEKEISNKYYLKKLKSHIEIYENVPLNLVGDYKKIYKILYNLMDNSFKFTDDGFVSMLIKLSNQKEEFITLEFIIEDSGVGISKFNLDKIYDAFYQEENCLERTYEGLGIGLNVVNNLVNLLEGSLNIQSIKNRGTKASIKLDLRKKFMDFGDLIKEPTLIENSSFFVINNKIMTNELINEFSKDLKLKNYNYLDFDGFLENNLNIENNFVAGFIDYDILEKTSFKTTNKFIDYISKFNLSIYILASKNVSKSALLPIKYNNYIVTPLNKSVLYNSILESISIKNPKLIEDKSKEIKIKNLKKLNQKRVLLLDDSNINLLISKELLISLGFYVDDFNKPLEALEYLKDNSYYDLIVTDIEMPLLNGYEFALKIRDELKLDIPVIALSAENKIDNLAKYNLKNHIKKPIDKLQALEVLSSLFDDIENDISEDIINISIKNESKIPYISSIDVEHALNNLNNNENLLQKSLIDFFNTYKNFKSDFFKLKNEEKSRYLHTLKGLSGTLANINLFNESKKLELKSKKIDILESDLDFIKFKKTMQKFLNELKNIKLKEKKVDKDDFNLDKCKILFDNLSITLSKYDPISSHNILKKIDKYIYPSNINVEIDYLKKSLKKYDFKSGSKYCNNIKNTLNKVGDTNE